MSFGDILSSWDEARRDLHHQNEKETMDDWLDRYPPDASAAKKDGSSEEDPARSSRSRAYSNLRHGAELDLHGLTVTEATSRIDAFLEDAHRRGIRKVLIIHGKGLHSDTGESILAVSVRAHLQQHRLAGHIQHPPRKFGGRGALWVLVR